MSQKNCFCSVCGKFVSPDNDVAMLISCMGAEGALNGEPAHLLPTARCPGFPELAQYLPGQPLHESGFNPEIATKVKSAFAVMQKKF